MTSTTTLDRFKNLNKNTCTACGDLPAEFAEHKDAMTAGNGYCNLCASHSFPFDGIKPEQDYEVATQYTYITPKIAKILREAGFQDLMDVGLCTDEKLLSIKGIGKLALENIRKELEPVKHED